MAEYLSQRMVLGSKKETTEGTANAPLAADCNLLVEDVRYEADVDQFERNPISSDLSPYPSVAGKRKAKLTFKVELKGAGAAGTAPAVGKLIKACGFSETIVASTSVTYLPLSVGVDCMTFDLYHIPATGSGPRLRMVGSRGTYRINAKAGEPVYLEFTFNGVYQAAADAAALTPSGLETTMPQPFLSTAFTMQGSSAHKVSGFTIDMANALNERTDITGSSGILSYLITDRKPTFTMDPELETVATHDYYGKMLSNATGSMSVALTGSAGNIVTVTAPAAQYVKVVPGDRNGLKILNIDGKFNRNAGNDELSIAFT